MALRKERDALNAGLGIGVVAAKALDEAKKRLNREFRVPGKTRVLKPSKKQKEIQERIQSDKEFYEKQMNPRIDGLAGVPGITVDEDGKIGLQELRKQRPDVFEMEPKFVAGMEAHPIAKLIANRLKMNGRKDRYEQRIADSYAAGSGKVSSEAEEE